MEQKNNLAQILKNGIEIKSSGTTGPQKKIFQSPRKLKFANVKQTSPLTYGLVEEALKDCIESEDAVKNIIKHIKSKRQTSFKYDIKRSYS